MLCLTHMCPVSTEPDFWLWVYHFFSYNTFQSYSDVAAPCYVTMVTNIGATRVQNTTIYESTFPTWPCDIIAIVGHSTLDFFRINFVFWCTLANGNLHCQFYQHRHSYPSSSSLPRRNSLCDLYCFYMFWLPVELILIIRLEAIFQPNIGFTVGYGAFWYCSRVRL